jgi:acyl-coenzyme A thioesterase PaaI-like protein
MQPEAGPATGAEAHLRALETLYASAPINALFESRVELPAAGQSRIHFDVREDMFHAANAAHGTLYFKMLDDAAFYAANGLVSDRFLLTTAFNLHFTKPLKVG